MTIQKYERIGRVVNTQMREAVTYVAKASLVLGAAAIGAAIGSAFGPLGMAIGALVGAFVGTLAAAMLDKIKGMRIRLGMFGAVDAALDITYA